MLRGGMGKKSKISDIQKQGTLEKVLASDEFKGTGRYQEILSFITNASIENRHLKESILASEIFGKDKDFLPADDPTVRVYMSNLRKKLEHYYFTEGAGDEIRLNIPKGHYYVEFNWTRDMPENNKFQISRFTAYLFISILTILFLATGFLLFKKSNSAKTENPFANDPVWADFFAPEAKPPLLVIGDYLFLYQRKTELEGEYFVRSPAINTSEDFTSLLKSRPELIQKYVLCDFTYIRPSIAWSIIELLPVLLTTPDKIFLKLASELKWEDINNYNVIFVGSFKSLFIFRAILNNLNIKYEFNPPSLQMANKVDLKINSIAGNTYQTDISLTLKCKGPNNNYLMLLVGFDEVGIIEAAKTVTSVSFSDLIGEDMYTTASEGPFLFELVQEVEGINQTGFKKEIRHFKILE